MKLTQYIIYLTIGLLSANIAVGQDIHFTQFYNSPLNLNPASTGDFTGDWRLSGSFRSQWGGQDLKSYRTSTIAFDMPFFIKEKQIGLGAIFINDRAHNGLIINNKLYVSGGYGKRFNGHVIHGGLQFGYSHTSPSEFSFPNQYDGSPVEGGGQYNSELDNGEGSVILPKGNFDLNTGISWKKRLGSKFEPKVGLALFHLFTTNASLTGGKLKVPLRTAIYATPKLILSPKLIIAPHFQYMTTKANSSMLLGSNFIVGLPRNKPGIKNIYAGVMTSMANAKNNGSQEESSSSMDGFGFIAGLQFPHLDIGFSYDLMLSNVGAYFGNPFEITFIYIAPSTLFNRKTIPCERL